MNYQKIYDDICHRSVKHLGYTEVHHIVPKSMGGTDSLDNLVRLSAREHYICHWLLTKIYPTGRNHYKAIHAFWMMHVSSKNNETRYVNSRQYADIKSKMSEVMSIAQSGENNSNFGNVWIHNKELKQSSRMRKTDQMPYGWELGRVINWDVYTPKEIKSKAKIRKEERAERLTKIKRIKDKHRRIRSSYEYRSTVTRKIYVRYANSGLSLRKFAESENLVAMTLSKWFRQYIDEYQK